MNEANEATSYEISMTNKFLRISPEINSEWEEVSAEVKGYFYQTFTSQILSVFNHRKAHDGLKYDFVEREELVKFMGLPHFWCKG